MAQKPPDFFADELLERAKTLPSLRAAFLAQDLSAKVGFDFKDIELVLRKVKEEHRELLEAFEKRSENPANLEEELGDNFFALVNLSRHLGIDPEELVHKNVAKYLQRCNSIEEKLRKEGRVWQDCSLEEIYKMWRESKNINL